MGTQACARDPTPENVPDPFGAVTQVKPNAELTVGDAEVNRRCRRVSQGSTAEAHAQQLDVCLDEEGRIHVDLTLCICLGADVQADSCTTLSALERTSQNLVLDRLVVAGEVHLERSSGGSETSLGLTEGSKFFAASLTHRAREGGNVQLVAGQVQTEAANTTDSLEVAQDGMV